VTDYDQLIHNALSTDPLEEAEVFTGKSQNDDQTMWTGFAIVQENVADRNRLMDLTDDTKHASTLVDYMRIAQSEGFEIVHRVPFVDSDGGEESLYVLFHPTDAILLVFDTYRYRNVKGGQFHYNWRPTDRIARFYNCCSSGGWRKSDDVYTWEGSHDCREALRFKLRQLRKVGSFVNPWVIPKLPWMCHYMDCRGDYDHDRYERINRERLAALPPNVRAAMGYDDALKEMLT
jgi:hypothetical protein